MDLPTQKVIPIPELKPAKYNPRKIHPRELEKLCDSIKFHGFVEPIVVNQDNTVIGGHQRLKAAEMLGMESLPCVCINIPKEQEKALNLALNRIRGEWDEEMLAALIIGLDEATRKMTGFDADEIEKILKIKTENEQKKAILQDRFLIPPMSILDSRQGYWQDRKRKWLSFGIKSEEGRGVNLLKFSDTILDPTGIRRAEVFGSGAPETPGKKYEEGANGILMKSNSGRDPIYYQKKREVEAKLGYEISTEEFEKKYYTNEQIGGGLAETGTSIFDPVLCELAYRWFMPKGGRVLDPFAGGSVRGIVASILEAEYVGIELRAEQVEANKQQAEKIIVGGELKKPIWIHGDAVNADTLVEGQFDFIFSCPPYGDLEKYSDEPGDLSNMKYADFKKAYKEIIRKSCEKLKDNRFACFVVGDIRDEKGIYRNFVGDTIEAFQSAGLNFYNEAIFITPYGSLPIRVGRQFEQGRKLGKTHQNILVFQKGDPEEACKETAKFFDEYKQLAEHHKKVLVFAKGNPEIATEEAGPVKVDAESFILNNGETL